MVHLTAEDGRTAVLCLWIAERQRGPVECLERILLPGKRAGFVANSRGTAPRQWLITPAEAITSGEIVRMLDGPLSPVPCGSQITRRTCTMPVCAGELVCPLQGAMRNLRKPIAGILDHDALGTPGHPQPERSPMTHPSCPPAHSSMLWFGISLFLGWVMTMSDLALTRESRAAESRELILAAYSVPKEAYEKVVIPTFQQWWKARTGQDVRIRSS